MRRLIIVFVFTLITSALSAQNAYLQKAEELDGGNVISIKSYNDTLVCYTGGGSYLQERYKLYISYNNGESWDYIGSSNRYLDDIFYFNNYVIALTDYQGNLKIELKNEDISIINIYTSYNILIFRDKIYSFSPFGDIVYYDFPTFQWIRAGVKPTRSGKFKLISPDDEILFAAGGQDSNQLFRSTDDGASWEEVNLGIDGFELKEMISVGDKYFAISSGENAKLYSSENKGLSWKLINTSYELPSAPVSITSIEGALYICTNSDGIYKSTNDASTWQELNAGLNHKSIFLAASSSDIFTVNGRGVYKFNKDHESWVLSSTGISDLFISTFANFKGKLFIGTENAGLYSDDGYAKRNINVENGIMNIVSLSVYDDKLYLIGDSIAYGSENRLFTSEDGEEWSRSPKYEESKGIRSLFVNEDYIFYNTGEKLFREKRETGNLELLGESFSYNTSGKISGNQNSLLLDEGAKLLVSYNNGDSWEERSYLSYSRDGFFVDTEGNYYFGDSGTKIFKSTNDGHTWDAYAIASEDRYNSIKFINRLPGADYVIDSYSAIHIGNIGLPNWQEVNTGDEKIYATTITQYNGNVYVGTSGDGLYQIVYDETTTPYSNERYNSTTITLRWSSINAITRYRIQIASDELFTDILADEIIQNDTTFTYSRFNFNNFYYWRVSSVTEHWDDNFSPYKKIEIVSPPNFQLRQNYPNPFNLETTITFDLPEDGRAILILYDILGRKISTLSDKMYSFGNFEVKFNANSLSTGVYFLELKQGNYRQTIKIVLIK